MPARGVTLSCLHHNGRLQSDNGHFGDGVQAGRLELPLAFADWLEQAADERMLLVVPLDVRVVLALDSLPRSFHGDPAHRLIVATARSRQLPLATHDTTIRRSRTVTLWKA